SRSLVSTPLLLCGVASALPARRWSAGHRVHRCPPQPGGPSRAGPPCGCPDPSRHVRSDGRWCGPRARPARGARPGTYVVLALLVVLLRARIISLASGTPRNRGQLTPRRRGGVPKTDSGVAPMSPSSPPTRGCSEARQQRPDLVRVLPADAGVFRDRPRSLPPSHSPPRRRGGVPSSAASNGRSPTSSPPTRGCSVASAARLIGRLVLPADAGVFRWTTRSRQGSRRPPRRRGGVPNSSVEPAFQLWSSPPTRGCSAGRDLGVVAHAVLPADAGVFRSPAPNCCAPPSPPRRRGGVPVSALFAAVVSASSPPTRGCSDAGRLPVLGEGVLPADAGCSGMLSPSVNFSNVLPADAGVFRRAPSS